MKPLVYFLLVHLFALTLFPCADVPCANEPKQATEETAFHNSHNSENDTCSPFCVCACCAMSVHLEKMMPFNTPVQVYNDLVATSMPFYKHLHEIAIWNPPKLRT